VEVEAAAAVEVAALELVGALGWERCGHRAAISTAGTGAAETGAYVIIATRTSASATNADTYRAHSAQRG
jgi:hypothetical protein